MIGIGATGLPSQEWQKVLPGIWRASIGPPDQARLTEVAEAHPKQDGIRHLGDAKFPFSLKNIQLRKTNEFSSVEIPLQPGEKIFGLGLQMVGSDRRGSVYHLRLDHYESGHDRLHAPTPLYVSSLGYAVFFNTSRSINVYVGVGNRLDDPQKPAFRDRNTDKNWDGQPDSGHVEVSVQGAGLELYAFAGPTSMQALQRYNLFCGGGAMPPLWALGFWHRTPLEASAKEVIDEAREFQKRKFPLDVIGLEPGWQSRSYPGSMLWSPIRFPHPKAFVQELLAQGIRVNLWENPYVAPNSDLYNLLTPHFGSHTVWLGAVPDLYSAEAAKVVREFHRQHHLALGVSGYKIDEVDGFDNWLWPDHAQFPSGLDGLQMRQIYGVLWQKELDRMFRESGERTFGLVRSSNGGASRFPFAIYSDTYDHRQYVTALTNSALAGVLWCAEIRSASSSEEWVRRMQSACLSPIAQLNAWDSGAKPWSFPDVEGLVREVMELRESLAPYLYTTFSQYCREGIPPVRPMSLVDGGVETDQYLLGDSLLVAPMFTGEHERTVRLPMGNWYDYKTGKRVGSHETITIKPSLGEIPLYVREGAAIPTNPPTMNLSAIKNSDPYLLRCYGPGPWKGNLYEDDGVTLEFEKGNFGIFDLTANQDANATWREGGEKITHRNLVKVLVEKTVP